MNQFIPKAYKKEPITIRISYEKLETIDEIVSLNEKLSRSEVINQCIDYAIANLNWDEVKKEKSC